VTLGNRVGGRGDGTRQDAATSRRIRCAAIPDLRAGTLPTIPVPFKSAKPLKRNDSEKCRNHRQNSSKLVKTGLNTLIQKTFQ